jgi:hypothetical protein
MSRFWKNFVERLYKKRAYYKSALVTVAVLLIFVWITHLQGTATPTLTLSANQIAFSPPTAHAELEEFVLFYEEIDVLSLESEYDLGSCTEAGCSSKRGDYGIWQNQDLGRYYCSVDPSIASVILAKTADGNAYVFNTESDEVTEKLYTAIKGTLR